MLTVVELEEFSNYLRSVCARLHHDWDKSRKARLYCARCGKVRRPR